MKIKIGLAVLAVIAAYLLFHDKKLNTDELFEKTYIYAKETLRKDLNDPDSLRTRNLEFRGSKTKNAGLAGAVCGEYAGNDKNGVITDYNYFVVNVHVDKKGQLVSLGRIYYPERNNMFFKAICNQAKERADYLF